MTAKNDDLRDANLRVSRRVHNNLKTAAALMGRPLYDVTSEAIDAYLSKLQIDPVAAIRRNGKSRKVP
ncbi:hypothetical protein [Dokdonella ginsengisoli]|uniref:Uncharacterized protein n=1 Tax=Dokdonella ginsengisoli TaxID=363846 RepID=A0ABV9QWM9_9GAMM